jgi:hypothetical protein
VAGRPAITSTSTSTYQKHALGKSPKTGLADRVAQCICNADGMRIRREARRVGRLGATCGTAGGYRERLSEPRAAKLGFRGLNISGEMPRAKTHTDSV